MDEFVSNQFANTVNIRRRAQDYAQAEANRDMVNSGRPEERKRPLFTVMKILAIRRLGLDHSAMRREGENPW